ncbi:MAG: hypothetical protein JST61_04920 [Acidobacteria bacterium]|nr:hypothetical protein [Acidobacteriota bacterium]
MGFWSKAFRLTAVFLVLFTAVEVLACDLLPSSDCYISNTNPPLNKHHAPNSGDNCMCCCAHLVLTKHLDFTPYVVSIPAPREISVEQPLLAPRPIDHPPQLS